MVGRLPPPPLVRADTHCLQTSPAPALSDLHCHCCAATAFLVVPPLPLLPRRCYLPCRAAATAFLAAWPPLPSSPRGRRCLPCCAAAAAFLTVRPPLPYCLSCRAAANPSRLGTLRPSPCLPFRRVPQCNPPWLPTPLPRCRRRTAGALPPPPTRSTIALPAATALLPTAPALLTHCRRHAASAAVLSPPPTLRCRQAAAKLPPLPPLLTF